MNEPEEVKLNLGSGRMRVRGFTNIDRAQIIDGNGNKTVDILMDFEKDPLPFSDSSVKEILADNVLEHIENLLFVMNECHRVIMEDGFLFGCVPIAGTREDFKDITHKRHFILESFAYLTGEALHDPKKPSHPKYADYGYLPWKEVSLKEEGNMILFKLSPRKVGISKTEYPFQFVHTKCNRVAFYGKRLYEEGDVMNASDFILPNGDLASDSDPVTCGSCRENIIIPPAQHLIQSKRV